ncbi:hypothetical protein DC904_13685 [Vibrio parahaemolyticus]|nr:hypothetical protein [Vibrio parahaemolyticus]
MFSHVDSALSVTKIYETCLSALNGALHSYLDSSNAMTAKELRKFKKTATEIANQGFSDTILKLKSVSHHIAYEERLRALTDANFTSGEVEKVNVDLSDIEASIRQDFLNATLSGVILAKKLMSQHSMLVSSGLSPASARIRVRERNRGEILQVYSIDRAGRKIRPNWAVYIKLAAFLNQLRHTEYMSQAAKLGFKEFELVQPGHARNGIRFLLGEAPEGELHPQSLASVRLVREG